MIPTEVLREINATPPDEQMDHPETSAFWRRRGALALGLHRDAPWVDVIGVVEHREYKRDAKFAGELALRYLRVEVERLAPLVEAARAWRAGMFDPVLDWADDREVALVAAVDALDRWSCCDLHGRDCEPPSELCCHRCTEASHPDHTDGSICSAPDVSRLPTAERGGTGDAS